MIGNNQLAGKSSYIRIPYDSGKTTLKDVLEILIDRCQDKFEFVDTRTDFYAYASGDGSCNKINFGESYIIKDKISCRYIYFILDGENILITTSDIYNKLENICWQENMPKGYLNTKSAFKADSGKIEENKERYLNERYPCIFLMSVPAIDNSDIYIVNNEQSFSIVYASYIGDELMNNTYKKKCGKQTYIIYDTSDKYHTTNSFVSCIHTNGDMIYYSCVDTDSLRIDVDMVTGSLGGCYGHTGFIYVPADTYDDGESGYYIERSYINELTPHNNLLHKYLVEPVDRKYVFLKPTELHDDRPTDDSVYHKIYSFNKNFAGLSFSSMNILYGNMNVPKYTQTVFNTNNYYGSYLGINLYSGLRSTLNNMSIALPNIIYIMRQPSVLENMSAVEESTFMYMVDMEDKSNGDVVECIDNYGNKIKLICFMTYQSVTNLFSSYNNPKQLGIGIRLE